MDFNDHLFLKIFSTLKETPNYLLGLTVIQITSLWTMYFSYGISMAKEVIRKLSCYLPYVYDFQRWEKPWLTLRCEFILHLRSGGGHLTTLKTKGSWVLNIEVCSFLTFILLFYVILKNSVWYMSESGRDKCKTLHTNETKTSPIFDCGLWPIYDTLSNRTLALD